LVVDEIGSGTKNLSPEIFLADFFGVRAARFDLVVIVIIFAEQLAKLHRVFCANSRFLQPVRSRKESAHRRPESRSRGSLRARRFPILQPR
jgi:hypothetical protein